MMKEYDLKEVLEEVCLRQAMEFVNAPKHHFSLRHRRAIKKILSANNKLIFSSGLGLRALPMSKRIAVVAVLIFLALFTITAAAFTINGFIRKEHRDNTQLLTANLENSPSRIEYEYYLPEIPDGYELQNKVTTPFTVCSIYINTQNCYLTFKQEVKMGYEQHFDTERASFEEVEINSKYGLYLDFGNEQNEYGDLVWDNGDYILEIVGDFNKDYLMNLANSTKILKN